jgi:SagB-type dehydrogenase family enzyme
VKGPRGDSGPLECLRSVPAKRKAVSYAAGQKFLKDAAAVFLMTAVFPRTMWKYRFPRAYCVVLLDAGHLCQTFCLVATWLGLAPFCTAALKDSEIEKDLSLDGIRETALYLAAVGAPVGRSRSKR